MTQLLICPWRLTPWFEAEAWTRSSPLLPMGAARLAPAVSFQILKTLLVLMIYGIWALDHLGLDPDISPDEQEEKARLISQVLELQNTLDGEFWFCI
jgi:hypothetical protein